MPSVRLCHQPAKADHARLYEILVGELTDFAVFLTDPTGCIVSWNPGVERILGYREAEWLGHTLELIFTPEDWAQGKHEEEMTAAARNGRAPDIRWHMRKNGERLYVEGTMVALRDEAGQLLGFSKVMRDITARRKNEERNAFLVRLDDALRPLTDPEEMMHSAARLLGEHLRADRCTYCHVAADEETLDILWDYCRPGLSSMVGRYRLTQFGATVAQSLRVCQPCIVEDVELDPSLAEVRAVYRQAKVRAHISVPLGKAGQLVAIMAVHQQTPRHWQPEEVDLVRLVINRCWEFVERARTAADLRENQARLSAALAVAQLGAFEWDLLTNGVKLDDRSRAIFGFGPGEGTSSQEIFARIDPSVFDRVFAEAQASQRQGSRLETEYPIRVPGDSVRTITSVSDTTRGASGRVERIFGVFSDITDRKRQEIRQIFLLELADQLRTLANPHAIIAAAVQSLGRHLAASRVGYGQVQPDGESIVLETNYVNGMTPLTGPFPLASFGAESIAHQRQGRTLVLNDVTSDPAYNPAGWAAIETRAVVSVPLVRHGQLRAEFYVHQREARSWLPDEVSLIEEVAARTWDAVERARAEEVLWTSNKELRRVNRELEEFAYVASHDLQEPLRMVNIYTQLILKRLPGNHPSLAEYADFVRRGVSRMEGLIRDLLTYSRTVQRDELPVGTADLSASLAEAVSVLRNRLEESDATLHTPPLPCVRGDTQQLAHVFQNLLSNALKYRKADVVPEIHITAEPDGAQWIISVRDNGIGFEPQYAERIFGLFKRLHKDEYPGTGLGLAICQRIVERYGGRMWAEGRPGEGATFFLAIPNFVEK